MKSVDNIMLHYFRVVPSAKWDTDKWCWTINWTATTILFLHIVSQGSAESEFDTKEKDSLKQ